ncbi:hypothetical protein [Candidatus Accumulibacter sp. ACC012]|uniref:hypothetical protein n=1 Tax=Candidatus Accumulibacter sp. ACC012 TaxID=2823332 RepID=UPI0025C0D016|nr:hypothetical protein [Candidatus Accumulibacter sp. ACC012]
MLPIDMDCAPRSPRTRSLTWAVALSLIVHGVVLFFPQQEPTRLRAMSSRFEATLSPTPQAARPSPPRPATPPQPLTPPKRVAAKPPPKPAPKSTLKPAPKPTPKPTPKPPATAAVKKPTLKPTPPQAQPQPRVITVPAAPAAAVAQGPRWFTGEKYEMKRFLDDLEAEAKPAAKPKLAQSALAMARSQGQQQARNDEEGTAILERLPNTPPPAQFSLDFYVDGVVKRLNRSAAFVRNDPRSKGMRMAAVHFRINPDGSLKTFKVLNAGDQQEEIAFIKSVVERAIPFSAFPADIARSARSLGITICIQPNRGGGFGFARVPDGRKC